MAFSKRNTIHTVQVVGRFWLCGNEHEAPPLESEYAFLPLQKSVKKADSSFIFGLHKMPWCSNKKHLERSNRFYGQQSIKKASSEEMALVLAHYIKRWLSWCNPSLDDFTLDSFFYVQRQNQEYLMLTMRQMRVQACCYFHLRRV